MLHNGDRHTTVGAEVVLDIVSTICLLGDFFWTSGDTQGLCLNDIAVGIGRPGEFTTVETVAESLEACEVRIGTRLLNHKKYLQTAEAGLGIRCGSDRRNSCR